MIENVRSALCWWYWSLLNLQSQVVVGTLLYCIVLYLYISIALLAVRTNQKRFQCERPREKRAVLRQRKEELGSPVNKVDRVYRSWSQNEGPIIAKARVWTIEVLASLHGRWQHFFIFDTSLVKVQVITLSAAIECAKEVDFGPWSKKVVHTWPTERLNSLIMP